MDNKTFCWDVKVAWQEMDMSGGDIVDGPRWTGGYVKASKTLAVVAPTEALASATALTLFYGHQKASIESVVKVRDIHATVQVSLL